MSLFNAAKDVCDFHRITGTPVLLTPTILPEARANLRKNLRDEEAVKELDEAIEEQDLIKLLDAIIDSIYILLGTAAEAGLTPQMVEEGWQAVHSSNMTKIDPVLGRAIVREDGKVLKPATFKPADIIRVFENEAQRYRDVVGEVEAYLAVESEVPENYTAESWKQHLIDEVLRGVEFHVSKQS